MKIKSTTPAPPPASVPLTQLDDPQNDAEADAPSSDLHALAARFTELSYGGYPFFEARLIEMGATECVQLADENLVAPGCVFIYEERAWVVFHGTNDVNDAAHDLWCLPGWHFGFHRCFANIEPQLDSWIAKVSAQVTGFCMTGHSLGGAIATLIAEHLSYGGHPVELLCTFGSPRVYSPWGASRFEGMSANLPESKSRLSDVSVRYIDPLELVCHVPPFFLFFKHVGKRQMVTRRVHSVGFSRSERIFGIEEQRWRDDAMSAAADTERFLPQLAGNVKAIVVGLTVLVAAIFLPLIVLSRLFKGLGAHAMAEYADNIDAENKLGSVFRARPEVITEEEWKTATGGQFGNETMRILPSAIITLLIAFVTSVGLFGALLFALGFVSYWGFIFLRYVFLGSEWAGILLVTGPPIVYFLYQFVTRLSERRSHEGKVLANGILQAGPRRSWEISRQSKDSLRPLEKPAENKDAD